MIQSLQAADCVLSRNWGDPRQAVHACLISERHDSDEIGELRVYEVHQGYFEHA